MQTYDLGGRTIIVTGAGSGLGQAMALGLADMGANVVAVDVRDERLADTTSRREKSNVAISPFCADVTSEEKCGAIVRHALERFSGLHGVVNCAGLGMGYMSPDYHTKTLRFWEADPKRWQDTVDVNMRAPFLLARAATPHLLEQGWGRIVNVTTSFNTMIRGGNMPYGQTKAGLEAASVSWSEDLEGSGVTVNVLVPGGAADTRIIPPDAPFDRTKLISPTVMAAPICWLMSDLSDGVTGMRFIARYWRPDADWREAMKEAGSPAAWPALAAAASQGQPTTG